jgi:hypothetical protein
MSSKRIDVSYAPAVSFGGSLPLFMTAALALRSRLASSELLEGRGYIQNYRIGRCNNPS